MNDTRDVSEREKLVEMAQGYFRGKVLLAAVRLGLADALGDRDKGLDELAVAIACDAVRVPSRLSFLRDLEMRRGARSSEGRTARPSTCCMIRRTAWSARW